VAAAVAVLKYRLESIDRVIRHAVAALVMSAGVVAGYAAVVLCLTLAFTSATRPNLGTSLAAGAVIAALAAPLWTWSRRLADRAVFGKQAVGTVSEPAPIG
jgi:hypothetical protein